jgi:hypothetical protein
MRYLKLFPIAVSLAAAGCGAAPDDSAGDEDQAVTINYEYACKETTALATPWAIAKTQWLWLVGKEAVLASDKGFSKGILESVYDAKYRPTARNAGKVRYKGIGDAGELTMLADKTLRSGGAALASGKGGVIELDFRNEEGQYAGARYTCHRLYGKQPLPSPPPPTQPQPVPANPPAPVQPQPMQKLTAAAAEQTYDQLAASNEIDRWSVAPSSLPATPKARYQHFVAKWGSASTYVFDVDGNKVWGVAAGTGSTVYDAVYWIDLYAGDGTFLVHGFDDSGPGPDVNNWGSALLPNDPSNK